MDKKCLTRGILANAQTPPNSRSNVSVPWMLCIYVGWVDGSMDQYWRSPNNGARSHANLGTFHMSEQKRERREKRETGISIGEIPRYYPPSLNLPTRVAPYLGP